MNKINKYSPEVEERAVRLVQEHRSEYPSLWATIESIVPKIGCSSPTLHDWVKKHEIDTGQRDGVTSEERTVRVTHGKGQVANQELFFIRDLTPLLLAQTEFLWVCTFLSPKILKWFPITVQPESERSGL